MKKGLFIIASALFSIAAQAQVGSNDALNIFQNPYVSNATLFSQTFYEGTARTAAMGNAFTALGGDIGALSLNPASSGIYKYSEFSISPSLNLSSGKTNYLSEINNEFMAKPGVSSMGYVGTFNTYKRNKKNNSFNIAFAINKLNNFNSRMYATGTTNQSSWLGAAASAAQGFVSTQLDITSASDTYPFNVNGLPWRSVLAWNTNLLDLLPDSNKDYIGATENIEGSNIVTGGNLDQQFVRETTGNQSEIIINMGGSVGNKLFLGANIGIQSLSYTDYQKYTESTTNSSQFQTNFSSFTHIYNQHTSGVGVNAKLGLIYIPVKNLRLGATFTTPTIMTITDEWDEKITSHFGDGYSQSVLSPIGEFSYNLISPLKVGAGAAFVFGTAGIISADFEGVAYNWTRLASEDNVSGEFSTENNIMSDNLRFAKNFRLGMEVKPVPGFALRAGYAFYQNPNAASENHNHIISAGAGFSNKKGFFGDFAVQHKVKTSDSIKLYADYQGIESPEGTFTSSGLRVLMTFGFRF